MPNFVHVNGTDYELAAGQDLNEARELLERLASGAEPVGEFVVSLNGVRTSLKIQGGAVSVWAAYVLDENRAKGRLRNVRHV